MKNIFCFMGGCFLSFILLFVAACPVFASDIINLPKARISGKISLEESIQNRRSIRDFKSTPLNLDQIGQLLWSIQGITDPDWDFRSAPSAGAIYPLEIYIFKSDGVFHYMPKKHAIRKIANDDRRQALAQASLGQSFVNQAPVSFLIAAAYERIRAKYGGRAERYVFIEAGHAAENMHLQAVALGLGSIPVGAFWDDVTARVAGLPKDQYPLYIIPVGYPE
jgi:SagB-type dehydrogenase family enzyme